MIHDKKVVKNAIRRFIKKNKKVFDELARTKTIICAEEEKKCLEK